MAHNRTRQPPTPALHHPAPSRSMQTYRQTRHAPAVSSTKRLYARSGTDCSSPSQPASGQTDLRWPSRALAIAATVAMGAMVNAVAHRLADRQLGLATRAATGLRWGWVRGRHTAELVVAAVGRARAHLLAQLLGWATQRAAVDFRWEWERGLDLMTRMPEVAVARLAMTVAAAASLASPHSGRAMRRADVAMARQGWPPNAPDR